MKTLTLAVLMVVVSIHAAIADQWTASYMDQSSSLRNVLIGTPTRGVYKVLTVTHGFNPACRVSIALSWHDGKSKRVRRLSDWESHCAYVLTTDGHHAIFVSADYSCDGQTIRSYYDLHVMLTPSDKDGF